MYWLVVVTRDSQEPEPVFPLCSSGSVFTKSAFELFFNFFLCPFIDLLAFLSLVIGLEFVVYIRGWQLSV